MELVKSSHRFFSKKWSFECKGNAGYEKLSASDESQFQHWQDLCKNWHAVTVCTGSVDTASTYTCRTSPSSLPWQTRAPSSLSSSCSDRHPSPLDHYWPHLTSHFANWWKLHSCGLALWLTTIHRLKVLALILWLAELWLFPRSCPKDSFEKDDHNCCGDVFSEWCLYIGLLHAPAFTLCLPVIPRLWSLPPGFLWSHAA